MFDQIDDLMQGQPEYGQTSSEQVAELAKALLAPETSGELYDNTSSGGVVTMQSLEGVLADLTLNENDFTLWKDINKLKAFSTVEEYDQQVGHGISDGGFVGQMENPQFNDPDFQKQIAIVKYMSEGWQVGDVSMAVRKIIDEKSRQQRSAMIRLLRNVNTALYNGDSTMVPESFDGLAKTISAESTDQVRDLRGLSVDQGLFNLASQLIQDGNGNPDNAKVYASPAGIKSLHDILSGDRADSINNYIINSGDKNVSIGSRIKSIETPFGTMATRTDKLLGMCYENKGVPQIYDKSSKALVEGATSEKAPSMPSIALTVNAATVVGSLFSATGVRPSGVAYKYRVAAKNKYGRSKACAAVTAGSAVAAAGSITVTITPNQNDAGSKAPTAFEVYGEKVDGSGIYRYITTVAASALADVTYEDKNAYIPGTARMYIIDQTSVGEQRVMGFSQLLPIHNTDLAKINRSTQGLINLYGVPKYYRPNVLIEIRNIGVDQTNVNKYNII